jgi:hypothetical protein
VSTETPTVLRTRPSSRGWIEPCELAVCLLPTACSGHRADPPSPAVALQVPLPSWLALHPLVVRPILFQYVPRASTDRCLRRGCTAGTLLMLNRGVKARLPDQTTTHRHARTQGPRPCLSLARNSCEYKPSPWHFPTRRLVLVPLCVRTVGFVPVVMTVPAEFCMHAQTCMHAPEGPSPCVVLSNLWPRARTRARRVPSCYAVSPPQHHAPAHTYPSSRRTQGRALRAASILNTTQP